MITYIPGGIVTSDGVLLDANGNPVLDEEGRPLVVAGESISPYYTPTHLFFLSIFPSLSTNISTSFFLLKFVAFPNSSILFKPWAWLRVTSPPYISFVMRFGQVMPFLSLVATAKLPL